MRTMKGANENPRQQRQTMTATTSTAPRAETECWQEPIISGTARIARRLATGSWTSSNERLNRRSGQRTCVRLRGLFLLPNITVAHATNATVAAMGPEGTPLSTRLKTVGSGSYNVGRFANLKGVLIQAVCSVVGRN